MLAAVVILHPPQPDRAVVTNRGQSIAIRRKSHGIHNLRVPPQGGKDSERGRIPDLDCPVQASRRQELVIRSEGDTVYRLLGTSLAGTTLVRGKVDDMEVVLLARRIVTVGR